MCCMYQGQNLSSTTSFQIDAFEKDVMFFFRVMTRRLGYQLHTFLKLPVLSPWHTNSVKDQYKIVGYQFPLVSGAIFTNILILRIFLRVLQFS